MNSISVEKFIEYLQKAEKIIQSVDHMIYVTLPIVKDKRLLFKILSDLHQAGLNIVNAILQYDHINKKITLTKDPRENLRIFVENCSPRYGIEKREVKTILELINIMDKHKKSPLEFIKDEKIIILSENLKPETITIEKTKEFLLNEKSILKKVVNKIKEKYKKT